MASRPSGEDMEETHERPRVRIPSREAEREKFGHNAWAQEKHKSTQSKQGVTTNEDSEQPAELPQIPPTTPKTPKSADLPTLNPPKQRIHIKPVTPLKLNKNRAATDPPLGSAVPPPLFAGRKVGIAELRHKFSKEGSIAVQNPGGTDLPPLPPPSDKVARVLGAQATARGRLGKTLPTSAPASTNAPAPYRTSTEEQYPSRHGSPQRQVKSTPVPGLPTSRFFNENPGSRLPVSSTSASSQKTYETAPKDYSKPGPRVEAMILGDGRLSPSKSGAYGRMANVEMQEYPARVSSMVGIVGNVLQGMEGGEADPASYPHGFRPQDYPRSDLNYDYPLLSAHALPESTYSPSIYNHNSGVSAGEWEALQQQYPQTLPPFSPRQPPLSLFQSQTQAQAQAQAHAQQQALSQQHPQSRDVSTASTTTLPFLFRGHAEEITPTTTTHPTYSTPPQQPFILPAPPPRPLRPPQQPTPTTTPHRAPDNTTPHRAPANNAPPYSTFVPTPPHPHFRPSSTSTLTSTVIDEHLAAFAIELHHHLEMSTRRLLHEMEARSDRLGDEVARGLERLVVVQREGLGELGRRVEGGVREEGRRGREEVVREVREGEERVVRAVGEVLGGLGALGERVGVLEGLVGEGRCRCGEGGGDAGRGALEREVEKEVEKEKEQEKEKEKPKPPFHKRAFSRSTNPSTSPTKTHTSAAATTTTTAAPAPASIPTTRHLLAADLARHQQQQHQRLVPEPDVALHPAFQTHYSPHHQSHQHPHQTHQHSRSQPQSHLHSRERSRDVGLGLGMGMGQEQWTGQGPGQAWRQGGRGEGDGQGQGERGERGVGMGEVVFRAPSWGEGGWYRQAYGS